MVPVQWVNSLYWKPLLQRWRAILSTILHLRPGSSRAGVCGGLRVWGSEEDKELLSKSVMSTLLRTTEGILRSVRGVNILAVTVWRKRCITLYLPTVHTSGNEKESAVPSSFTKDNVIIYYRTVDISKNISSIFRILFHVHKNILIYLSLKGASWTETASDFPHPSSPSLWKHS